MFVGGTAVSIGFHQGNGEGVMARNESDREDLFREATALRRRLELRWKDTEILIGTRAGNRLSLFWGPDFSLGFNADHELRRAFENGVLYRAQSGRHWVRLKRSRESGGAELVASILSNEETEELLRGWCHRLAALVRAWQQGECERLRAHPAEEEAAVELELRRRAEQLVAKPLRIADGMV